MSHNNKKVIVSLIYRSPSQKTVNLTYLYLILEKLVIDIKNRKPYLSVITGDFNARSSSWWSNDIITTEGTKLFAQTSSDWFQQLINEPTHLQKNSSSCIVLIFTDQPNMSINYGVHASLHPNYHHQIVHASFNLHTTYPPSYQRLIWDYKKVDKSNTRKALDLTNLKNVLAIRIFRTSNCF